MSARCRSDYVACSCIVIVCDPEVTYTHLYAAIAYIDRVYDKIFNSLLKCIHFLHIYFSYCAKIQHSLHAFPRYYFLIDIVLFFIQTYINKPLNIVREIYIHKYIGRCTVPLLFYCILWSVILFISATHFLLNCGRFVVVVLRG